MATASRKSILDPKANAADMQYLRQKNSRGWFFRMATPSSLIGKPNPWDGRPFGKEIVKGLGTRRIGEAKKLRDVLLSDVRRLELHGHEKLRFSTEEALLMRGELDRVRATDPETAEAHELIITDQLDAAKRKGVDQKELQRYARIAFRAGYPLDEALRAYATARGPESRSQFAPLSKQTMNDLGSAIKHLCSFMQVTGPEALFMQDVTHQRAITFRYEYLPNVSTHRAPNGLSAKTIKKNITLLKAVWDWAIQVGQLPSSFGDVWTSETRVRARSNHEKQMRGPFLPEQMSALLQATERGTREGDVLRLAIAGGCRVSEIALLQTADVEADGSGFFIVEGKTANARRFVPMVRDAQSVLQRRLNLVGTSLRLFPEWPVRDSSGKSGAVSQWFTRFRREVLGAETDGVLSLHSTRHTWRTAARRARVPEADVLQLGGWSEGKGRTDRVYDHGLTREQLRETQESIWDAMEAVGYLKGF